MGHQCHHGDKLPWPRRCAERDARRSSSASNLDATEDPMPTTIRLIRLTLAVSLLALAATSAAVAATPSFYVTNAFGFGHPPRVTGYAAGASGNVAPVTNLSGSATGLDGPFHGARDPQGLVWVVNSLGAGSLTAYAPGATGNTAPAATLAGPSTGLSDPDA